jgi:phytoene dehydrogenase-like protein
MSQNAGLFRLEGDEGTKLEEALGMEQQQTWDAAIIGGGLAGLTAAVFLAEAGQRVLVLEQGSRWGGRGATDEKDGCLFNIGPHALSKQGQGLRILRELGLEPHAAEIDPSGRLVADSTVHELPLTALGLLKSNQFSWREKVELARLLVKLPKIAPASAEQMSLHDWIHANLQGTQARNYFLTLCRLSTYSNDPQQISAGAVLRQMQVASGGVYYIHEGWQTLVEKLAARARQAGADLRTGQKVTAIRGAHPAMTVHLDDGTTIAANHVLAAINPQVTAKLTGATPDSQLGALCRRLLPVQGAALDVALRNLPDPDTHFALDLQRPLYYSNHSNWARLTRADGHSVLHVFKYHSAAATPNAQQDRQELEGFLDLLQPGWRQELVTSRYLPNIAVTYGLPTVERVVNARRAEVPETVVSDIPGLYLAGDWEANDALLADAACLSAKESALRMLR